MSVESNMSKSVLKSRPDHSGARTLTQISQFEGGLAMYVRNEEKESKDLGGGVHRKVLAYSKNLMNVELTFERGAIGAMHSHPHEQIGYIIEGSLRYMEEGAEDVILTKGDSYMVAPNVMHGIECLSDVKLLDIFTPMREDFV